METRNLIQATANVIKITNLKVGDVFKQIDESYSSLETYYGVVTDLMSTGEKSFITVLRYKKNYGSVEGEIKTYAGEKDINIFPASIEEVETYYKEAIDYQVRKIEDKKKELQKEIESMEKAQSFVSGEMSKQLTQMSYVELTQKEYLQKKEEQKRLLENI